MMEGWIDGWTWPLMQLCTVGSPHSSSSELSPQSSTLLQTWSTRRHTWSFLQRNGLVGGHGCFAAVRNTKAIGHICLTTNILYEKAMNQRLVEHKEKEAHKIFMYVFKGKPRGRRAQPYHTCPRLHRSYRRSRPCHRRPTSEVYIRYCCIWTHPFDRRRNLQSQRMPHFCLEMIGD